MAKNSSMVNVDAVKDVINTWNSALNSFTSNAPKASSCAGFTALSDAGFDTASCTSYDELLENLSSTLSMCGSTVDSYVESVVDSDIQTESEIPDEADVEASIDADTNVNGTNKNSTSSMNTTRDSGTNDGNSGNYDDQTSGDEEGLSDQNKGNDGSDINPDDEESGIGDAATTLKEQDIGDAATEYDYILDKYFKELSKDQLQNIVSEIYLLAKNENVTIEELLTNEKYYDSVLGLLKANNIELSTDIDAATYRNALYSKFAGENNMLGLNSTTKENLKAYLTTEAEKLNMSYSDLVNDSNNTDALKETIQNYTDSQESNEGLSLFTNSIKGFSSEETSYTINTLLNSDVDSVGIGDTVSTVSDSTGIGDAVSTVSDSTGIGDAASTFDSNS